MASLCAGPAVATAERPPEPKPEQKPEPAEQPAPAGGASSEVGPLERSLSIATALVPGAIFHGAGHWVLGEKQTRDRLAWIGVGSVGVAALGAIPLAASGASRKIAGPTIPLMVMGAGGFLVTWLADLWGASGASAWAGRVLATPVPVEVALGYAYVRDPQFAYSSFAHLQATLERGPWRASPTAWIAVDNDNRRFRATVSYRLLEASAAAPTGDGSFAEIGIAASHHDYGSERFWVGGGELFLGGRYDGGRLAPTLRGSFAELTLGLGVLFTRYDGIATDDSSQLLARFAYGMYIGNRGGLGGEIALYYDHRRDDLAGGLASASVGGFLGHFGISGELWWPSGWGVVGAAETGSANIVQLSLARRWEPGP